MKNIIDQTPHDVLRNMIRFSTMYLANSDIKNKKVLDIGCGYGWFEIYALKKGARSAVGTELSEADLTTAKKYVKDPKARFLVGDATKLPFGGNEFDTIVTWEVLEHIPRDTEVTMFSEIKRVLKKGGVCYLSTPYRSFWSVLLDPAYWLAGHRHYRKEDIIRFVGKAGLKLVDLRIIGGMWVSLYMLNLYIAKWIFHRSPFMHDYMMGKIDGEYEKAYGNYNLFCILKKV